MQTLNNYINESIETSVNQTKMTVVNTVADEISVGIVNVCTANNTIAIITVGQISKDRK